MARREPEFERASEESSESGFFARLQRLFRVGPLAWVFKSLPRRTRFRPGSHMHGLDHHDIVERDVAGSRSENDVGEQRDKGSTQLPGA